MNKKWISISYPRSGATWLRYFVRTCMGLCPDWNGNDTISHPNTKFAKTHRLIPGDLDYAEGIVVLVRNYKECIPRHLRNTQKNQQVITKAFIKSLNIAGEGSYIHPLDMLENFDGPKHLIFYEDLITKPVKVMKRLAKKMELDASAVLDNFEEHWNISISNYGPGSFTQGKNLLEHSSLLTPDICQEWDKKIIERHPELYKKYLQRYYNVHIGGDSRDMRTVDTKAYWRFKLWLSGLL